MPTITMPDFGVTGLDGDKSQPLRLDFDFGMGLKFRDAIEERGYRLAWSRAQVCPCAGVNEQTQQHDPNCALCKGLGWIYFGPKSYVLDETKIGAMTPLQKYVASRSEGVVIRGVMTGLGQTPELFDKLGTWYSGTSQVTVRAENRLGYADKLVALDSEIVYSEVITATAPLQTLTLRYPAISVNLIRSLSTRFIASDFELTAEGAIKWAAGKVPSAGEKIAVHYNTFPTWVVIDHPKSTRDTYVKTKRKTTTTPAGDPARLPVQAIVRYDFLQG